MTSPAFVCTPILKSGLNSICNQQTTKTNRLVQSHPHTPSHHHVTPTMSANRKFMVGGNWKCNLSKNTISDLVRAFNEGPSMDKSDVEVVITPPSLYLDATRNQLRPDFAVGAQNAWISAGGAFTGEVDAKMIADLGGEWVILGHSERRHITTIAETDEMIAEKARYASTQAGLGVIFCIGEKLEERESGTTIDVCERQLNALASVIDDWGKIVIAYEPVWAIGTGKVATPEQAEQVHSAVRDWLKSKVSQNVADQTRILYGGSVSPDNCEELAKQPNIDGFLVGGASMKPSFLDVIQSYKIKLANAV